MKNPVQANIKLLHEIKAGESSEEDSDELDSEKEYFDSDEEEELVNQNAHYATSDNSSKPANNFKYVFLCEVVLGN